MSTGYNLRHVRAELPNIDRNRITRSVGAFRDPIKEALGVSPPNQSASQSVELQVQYCPSEDRRERHVENERERLYLLFPSTNAVVSHFPAGLGRDIVPDLLPL